MAINQDLLRKQIQKAMKSQGGTLTKSQQRTAEKYGIVKPSTKKRTGANQSVLQRQIDKAKSRQGGKLTSSQERTARKYRAPEEPTVEQPVVEQPVVEQPLEQPVVAQPVAQPVAGEVAGDTYAKEMTAMLEKLANAQEAQRIAELKRARDTALGTIGQEREQLRPAFRQARSGVRGEGRASARNFDEYLATRGLSTSGSAAQGEIAQSIATQGQLGALGQQEAQAQADIARREQEIKQGTIDQVLDVGRQRDIDVMGGTMDILGQQQAFRQNMLQQQQAFANNQLMQDKSFSNQKELADITAKRQKDLAVLSDSSQIKYLEKQDELINARNAGKLNPIEEYEAKLRLDRQYKVGSYAPRASTQEIDEFSSILGGMANAIQSGDYKLAWQEYNKSSELRNFYDENLDTNLINKLKQNIGGAFGASGRMVR